MTLRTGELRGVELAGTGTALPCEVDDSIRPLDAAAVWRDALGEGWRAELEARGWAPDHVERRHGVALRHAWPRAQGATAERVLALAQAAANSALEAASLRASDLDAIAMGTATPPRVSASIAAQLGSVLGTDAAAVDLRAGGASGLAAWQQGAQWVTNGARATLVVAVDVVPEFLAAEDCLHRLLFSCGAAAFVLRSAPGQACGLEASTAGRVDARGRPFTIPASIPPADGTSLYFDGPDADYAGSIDDAWTMALAAYRGLSPSAPDHFVPYAVTRGQLKRVADRSGLAVDAALEHLRTHGCLGNASSLFQLAELVRSGACEPGDRVGSVAVGGGIAWHALNWRL